MQFQSSSSSSYMYNKIRKKNISIYLILFYLTVILILYRSRILCRVIYFQFIVFLYFTSHIILYTTFYGIQSRHKMFQRLLASTQLRSIVSEMCFALAQSRHFHAPISLSLFLFPHARFLCAASSYKYTHTRNTPFSFSHTMVTVIPRVFCCVPSGL